jgi:HD superfamily phosphohydrolase
MSSLEESTLSKDPDEWSFVFSDMICLQLASTVIFQRLRNISQLGVASCVFPQASHSRFEHSIGTMNLMQKVIIRLNSLYPNCISKIESTRLLVAALWHDVGHFSFSHLWDHIEDQKQKQTEDQKEPSVCSSSFREHENRSVELLHEANKECKYPLTRQDIFYIEHMILGKIPLEPCHQKPFLYQLVHGTVFDVDRLDYLVRDWNQLFPLSKNIPCPNQDRLINGLRIRQKDDTLMFHENIKSDLIEFLKTRQQMFSQFYLHPHIKKFESFILPALQPWSHMAYQNRPDQWIIMTDPWAWQEIAHFYMHNTQPIQTSKHIKKKEYLPILLDDKDIMTSIEQIPFCRDDA